MLRDKLPPPKLSRIAGADVSFSRGDSVMYAAVVVLDAATLETIDEALAVVAVDFPYIPGLLSFREGPALLEAFRKLRTKPDVIIFDGQGIAHPRGLGLASHMGLVLDTPTIGCAKKILLGVHGELEIERGARTPLYHEGSTVGAALRTKRNVKPVYVSQGHMVSLDTSLSIVLDTCGGYRIPEPTRRAHLTVNRLRKSSVQDQ